MNSLRFQSVFDIIGPVMIGPSSSHTAGAVRIVKSFLLFSERNQKKSNFNYLIPLQKPIVAMEQI